MQQKTEWATIGKIVAPFGIQGELKVFPLSDIPNRFARLDAIHLGPEHILYTIKTVRPYKGEMLLLRLSGIQDATSAEKLRGLDVCIPLDKLAKLPPDSYYQHDILGLSVSLMSGKVIGVIVDIIVTGSNDVYVVKGSDNRQFLIPAIKEVIKQVDLIRQMMYIDPIKGLLDEDDAVVVSDDDNAPHLLEQEESE